MNVIEIILVLMAGKKYLYGTINIATLYNRVKSKEYKYLVQSYKKVTGISPFTMGRKFIYPKVKDNIVILEITDLKTKEKEVITIDIVSRKITYDN